ncbi:hypothetical protein TNCV_4583421 [Trichonephila clavipes]|nr:hypothetical protein TNCV_4583421 [Trichonephila clavipes]
MNDVLTYASIPYGKKLIEPIFRPSLRRRTLLKLRVPTSQFSLNDKSNHQQVPNTPLNYDLWGPGHDRTYV